MLNSIAVLNFAIKAARTAIFIGFISIGCKKNEFGYLVLARNHHYHEYSVPYVLAPCYDTGLIRD